jgi:23S rRNA-/tRNA-specific pseudouridylate synthase
MSGPSQRWLVARSESLGSLLERAGIVAALGDGRVFVDGRRVTEAALELSPGARVEVYPARIGREAPRILAEDAGLVFVDKPFGMATEPERRGSRGVLTHEVARLLGLPVASVHALSRLDLGVSGVVLLGTTHESRKRVATLRSEGRLRRRYVAIASATPDPLFGEWTAQLASVRGSPKRRVATDGKPARTLYRVTGVAERNAGGSPCVLALEPLTGRTHQLRVQAASQGAPFYGDPTYGGPRHLVLADGAVRAFERVFLHAAWVELGDRRGRIGAELPREFSDLWQAAGGSPGALESATAGELQVAAPSAAGG